MAFAKGNKHAKGGKRPGSGRKNKTTKKIREEAAKIAKAYIEEHVQPVLDAYGELAGGRWVNHYNQRTGALIYKEWEVDAGTLRHYIDKLVPSPRLAPTDKDGKTVPPIIYNMPNLESED